MSLKLIIPEDIVEAVKIPSAELEWELDKELGLSLYLRGALSFGKARRLAGLSKWEFQKQLGQRQILRHYGKEELEEDIAYAKNSSK